METTPISPQKKLYNYRRENGLCPKCGKPLDRKGFYCEECRKKQTTYSRETRFNSERNAKSFRRKCSKPSFSTRNNKENCQNT